MPIYMYHYTEMTQFKDPAAQQKGNWYVCILRCDKDTLKKFFVLYMSFHQQNVNESTIWPMLYHSIQNYTGCTKKIPSILANLFPRSFNFSALNRIFSSFIFRGGSSSKILCTICVNSTMRCKMMSTLQKRGKSYKIIQKHTKHTKTYKTIQKHTKTYKNIQKHAK